MEAEEKDKNTPQSQLKLLIAKGKEQGYLTYHEVNDHLPSDIVDPEQIEDIVNMINDMGITVHETAPDTDDIIINGTGVDANAAAASSAASKSRSSRWALDRNIRVSERSFRSPLSIADWNASAADS